MIGRQGNRVCATLVFAALASSAASLRAQTSAVGQWTGVQQWPVEAIHTVLLPTGKVMFWQSWNASVGLWDPMTQQFSAPQQPPSNHNIFCSGHAWLADGRLFVAGGHVANAVGSHRADIYNPFTNKWANLDPAVPNVPVMGPDNVNDLVATGKRWYPSATTLGNGDVLVLSGDVGPVDNYGDTNRNTQIYRAATNTWQTLAGALRPANDLLPEYPRVFLAPDGRAVSISDYSDDTEFLDLTGAGSWSYLSETLDPSLYSYGPAVMYDTGKIAQFGGGDDPTNHISLLDLNQPSPQWTHAPQHMAQGRRQNNATILADGTVLITGGSSKPGFNDQTGFIAQAELWDPVTMTVTPMASASSIYRGYHSNALLLPDGRVLVAGGNHDGPFTEQKNAEIYSPPYLFKGARPTVTAAPDVVELGDSIFIATPDGADIAKALMVIPGAVTHAQNWTQRINYLEVAETTGGVNLTLPENPNHAPPGYYMLFLVNSNGVPSIAEWMKAELPTVQPDNANFNGDLAVDGSDMLVWQRNLGGPAGAARANGDANEDGVVDADDLAVWRVQFGTTLSPPSATIPEPSTLAMCGALILALAVNGLAWVGRRPSAQILGRGGVYDRSGNGIEATRRCGRRKTWSK
jgi:hypothetical protein